MSFSSFPAIIIVLSINIFTTFWSKNGFSIFAMLFEGEKNGHSLYSMLFQAKVAIIIATYDHSALLLQYFENNHFGWAICMDFCNSLNGMYWNTTTITADLAIFSFVCWQYPTLLYFEHSLGLVNLGFSRIFLFLLHHRHLLLLLFG